MQYEKETPPRVKVPMLHSRMFLFFVLLCKVVNGYVTQSLSIEKRVAIVVDSSHKFVELTIRSVWFSYFCCCVAVSLYI